MLRDGVYTTKSIMNSVLKCWIFHHICHTCIIMQVVYALYICKQSIVRSDKPIVWTRYYLNPSYSEFVYIRYRHFVYHRSHEYYRNLPGTMCITCLEKHTTLSFPPCAEIGLRLSGGAHFMSEWE